MQYKVSFLRVYADVVLVFSIFLLLFIWFAHCLRCIKRKLWLSTSVRTFKRMETNAITQIFAHSIAFIVVFPSWNLNTRCDHLSDTWHAIFTHFYFFPSSSFRLMVFISYMRLFYVCNQEDLVSERVFYLFSVSVVQ